MAKQANPLTGFSTSGYLVNMDPAKIKIVENYNVRDVFDSKGDADDAMLKASIKANGYETDKPMVIRIVGEDCYLVAGHRRLAAVRELIAEGTPIKTVACIHEAKTGEGKARDDAERTLDVITSNSGKPLAPAERGAAFLRLRKYGWKDVQIAQRAGCDVRYVFDLCTLAKAEPRLLALVKAKVISPTLASKVVMAHGDDAAAVVTKALEVAPLTGKKAGTVTNANIGKGETAVTGKAPVVVKLTPAEKAQVEAATAKLATRGTVSPGLSVTVAGEKPGKVAQPVSTSQALATLFGPFHAEDTSIIDATGDDVASCESPAIARALVLMLNQAWSTFKGKITTSVPETVPAAHVVDVKASKAGKANGKAHK